MDTTLEYLIQILKKELNHAQRVYQLLLQKEQILIQNHFKEFLELRVKEDSLFIKSRELEENRKSVSEILVKKLHLSPEHQNLSALIAKLEKTFSEPLQKLQTELKKILFKIKNQNQKCEILLKKTMEIVEYSIGLMIGKFGDQMKRVYNKNKQTQDQFYMTNLIDQKG